jgi:hypothetical protein
MASSGVLCSVALARMDVSEEFSASIIMVTRIGVLGTTLAVSRNRRTLRRNKKSVHTRATRCNIPEDAILHSHCRENLKSSTLPQTSVYLEALNERQTSEWGNANSDEINWRSLMRHWAKLKSYNNEHYVIIYHGSTCRT